MTSGVDTRSSMAVGPVNDGAVRTRDGSRMLSHQRSLHQKNHGKDAEMAVVYGVVWMAVVVVFIAAYWRIFAKAGRPGWASLIPIYNVVTLLHITGRSGWWTLGMFVPLLNVFVLIRLVFELARAFGRGIGFGVGLLLLSPIFVPVLGFGGSQYVGRNTAAAR
jgi:hypothetical protein